MTFFLQCPWLSCINYTISGFSYMPSIPLTMLHMSLSCFDYNPYRTSNPSSFIPPNIHLSRWILWMQINVWVMSCMFPTVRLTRIHFWGHPLAFLVLVFWGPLTDFLSMLLSSQTKGVCQTIDILYTMYHPCNLIWIEGPFLAWEKKNESIFNHTTAQVW